MLNIMIWGTGKYANNVFEAIEKDKCNFLGFVDSNISQRRCKYKDRYIIYSPEEALNLNVDYYIISATQSVDNIVNQAKGLGILTEKLIPFWYTNVDRYNFLDNYKKENFILKKQIKLLQQRLINAPYEYGTPMIKIKTSKELLEKIISDKSSLCRFGDGEFDIILNQERSWFQNCNQEMSKRLYEIIHSNNKKVNIAIADNYGNLEKYTEKAADSIREYLTPIKRKQHMELLNVNRYYYDAYVSRPYIMYKDKNTNMKEIVKLYKIIFKNRDIIMVEGKNTRTGIGNDLFEKAHSIRRILCPDVNAYDVYDSILNSVKKNANTDDLILISLGATATILAYDLTLYGLQAIDFGQFDNEYEWYLMQASDREVIEGKSVSEILWYKIPEDFNEQVENSKQIIERLY